VKPVLKLRCKVSSFGLNKENISIGEGQNTSTVETQVVGNNQVETDVKPRYKKLFEGKSLPRSHVSLTDLRQC
jgi:hypothetical protein